MLNIDTAYPGQTAGVTANYPSGEARNVTVSGDGLGTPWEQQIINDIRGFMEKVVADAPIVISGAPETALSSDVLTGLQLILLNRNELTTNGGDIPVIGDRLPAQHRDGLRLTRDSIVLLTMSPGSARNTADDSDLILPSSLQKQINATWVVGAGGGLPDALAIATNTWYRLFLVAKPDGTADVTWDTSPTAANFFADANAIAAGFSDSDLFRRIAWTRTDGVPNIRNFHNSVADPTVYVWDAQQLDVDVVTVQNVSREAFDLSDSVPPESFGRLVIAVDFLQENQEILLTTADQADTAPSDVIYTVRTSADSLVRQAQAVGEWEVDTTSQIFARKDDATSIQDFQIGVVGYRDLGIST